MTEERCAGREAGAGDAHRHPWGVFASGALQQGRGEEPPSTPRGAVSTICKVGSDPKTDLREHQSIRAPWTGSRDQVFAVLTGGLTCQNAPQS